MLKNNIHINKFTLILIILVTGFNMSVFPQSGADQSLLLEIEEGVRLMDEGNYVEADRKFKRALRNLEVLPADISYYFGKNSYFLDQYKQSINWLNKYIELKGTKGRYFEECVEYLNRAEIAYKLESEKNSDMVISEITKSIVT